LFLTFFTDFFTYLYYKNYFILEGEKSVVTEIGKFDIVSFPFLNRTILVHEL